jgi:hypothetical protein
MQMGIGVAHVTLEILKKFSFLIRNESLNESLKNIEMHTGLCSVSFIGLEVSPSHKYS